MRIKQHRSDRRAIKIAKQSPKQFSSDSKQYAIRTSKTEFCGRKKNSIYRVTNVHMTIQSTDILKHSLFQVKKVSIPREPDNNQNFIFSSAQIK